MFGRFQLNTFLSSTRLKRNYNHDIFLGVSAEEVASNAVEELKVSLENSCCVDEHLQDQVRFFPNHTRFAMLKFSSVLVRVFFNSIVGKVQLCCTVQNRFISFRL
jgi:RNA 3'-terminal phosphate cyclase